MLGSIISATILICLLLLFVASYSYEKETIKNIDKKEYPLYQFMPVSLFIMDKLLKLNYKTHMEQKAKERLTLIYGAKYSKERLRLHIAGKMAISLLVLFCVSLLTLLIGIKDNEGTLLIREHRLRRPNYNQGQETYQLEAKITKDNESYNSTFEITLDEQKLTGDKVESLMASAIEYIEKHIKGENQSLTYVQVPLRLIERIPDVPVRIQWSSSHPNIMDHKGTIFYENVDMEGSTVLLTAFISYYEYQLEYPISIRLYPKKVEIKELIEQEIKRLVQDQNSEAREDSEVLLPTQAFDGEVVIDWVEPRSQDAVKFLLFGVIVAILLFFLKEEELRKKVEQRNQQLKLDFPEFINKMALLISAGMTVSKAWSKITQDYLARREHLMEQKRYLYEEAYVAYLEMEGGISEVEAIERFGRRCKMQEFMKFSTLIIQNMRKGANTLLEALNELSNEAWGRRKEVAKILGEQASTKLIFPMMMMLLIVLVIIMVPALMSLSM